MKEKRKMDECERCLYGEYDEEYDEFICCMILDEDELIRLSQKKHCPYFRDGDEYLIVRKQN
ncbi:MAG: hypothetical protein E7399_06105 [Ruminococcaceae bacterium]|nr:hypothetical protein [Oscillospiraceae bacterium]